LPLSIYKPIINWLIDCDSVVIVGNDISLDQHKDAGIIYPIDDDDWLIGLTTRLQQNQGCNWMIWVDYFD